METARVGADTEAADAERRQFRKSFCRGLFWCILGLSLGVPMLFFAIHGVSAFAYAQQHPHAAAPVPTLEVTCRNKHSLYCDAPKNTSSLCAQLEHADHTFEQLWSQLLSYKNDSSAALDYWAVNCALSNAWCALTNGNVSCPFHYGRAVDRDTSMSYIYDARNELGLASEALGRDDRFGVRSHLCLALNRLTTAEPYIVNTVAAVGASKRSKGKRSITKGPPVSAERTSTTVAMTVEVDTSSTKEAQSPPPRRQDFA